jgi:benzoyl-CoA reductase subunit D
MITAGIDCGAKNTKTVIVKDGEIIGKGSVPTGFDQAKAVADSLAKAVQAARISNDEIKRIIGTGSGKNAINIAADTINEINAMAKAANFYYPNARTVADVGAEEGRAAKIDENGEPVDFAINEKCAAGAGAFIEAMARALEMNAQCVIFAEAEVAGLIHAKTAKPDISKAVHDAIASRIVSMIRRIGVNEDVVILGGVGRNPGFAASMQRELKLDNLYIPDEPEFGAATGAAVVAAEKE